MLLAATQTPLLSDPKWGVRLLPELCKVVLHLPSQARQVCAMVAVVRRLVCVAQVALQMAIAWHMLVLSLC